MKARLSRVVARRTFLAVGVILASASAIASIDYRVTVMPTDGTGALAISMKVSSKPGPIVFKSPTWEPGAYALSNYGNGVHDFSATGSNGEVLVFTHPDLSTWIVNGDGHSVTATYRVENRVTDGTLHFSGAATYLYVDTRKTEPSLVEIAVPEGWQIATGLDPAKGGNGHFSAPDYDVLIDSPVTVGKFRSDTYLSHGKPHEIVLYGVAKNEVDLPFLKSACKFVSDAEGNFFGEVPYKRYVWHFGTFKAKDGAGGLEHLNSTEIGLSSGVGTGAQSVLAHEFFHLWNVKRIRSSVLGPFDYTKLPKTGALWWLEGVTDYYANMIPMRYGWLTTEILRNDLARNIERTITNRGRLEISPYDSSYRVGEAAEGRGNSNGLKVSYYNTGWLLGFLLDLQIREHSQGKHSLDDVEMALWKECRNNQPGFPEDEIRNQCVRFGGPSLGDFYDRWVMHPGELPINDALASIGFSYTVHKTEVAQFPLGYTPSVENKGLLLKEPEATAAKSEVITEIDGVKMEAASDRQIAFGLVRIVNQHKPGDVLHTTVVRMTSDGTSVTLQREVTLTGRTVTTGSVDEVTHPSEEQLKLREAWLSVRPGTKAVSPRKP